MYDYSKRSKREISLTTTERVTESNVESVETGKQ